MGLSQGGMCCDFTVNPLNTAPVFSFIASYVHGGTDGDIAVFNMQ